MTSLINNVSSNKVVTGNQIPEQDKHTVTVRPDIKEAADSVEIKTGKKSKKKYGKIIGGIAAIGGLISVAVSLAIMIGKNPAKAAKVLKGNLNFSTKAYEEGSKLSEKILAKKGKFEITEESIISLFKDPNNPRRIVECPKDLLPNDGIFYHGTLKAKKIYESGFTPFISNQLGSAGRELGAGIYVTPDTRVAAAFSGLSGNIIPVKLAKDAKIALITEDLHKTFYKKVLNLVVERESLEGIKKLPPEVKNAMIECTIRNILKHAGYDAAYIPKGVKSCGIFDFLRPDVNKVIGVEQKQLIIFSPEKLEIVQRTFIQRVGDVKDKLAAFVSAFKYSVQHPFGF